MTVHGFSLELDSAALTCLADLPAAAVCLHGGRVIVSDGVSLYRIGGDTDDGVPIAARFTLPPVNAATPSRLLGLDLDGLIAGELAVTARSEAGSALEGLAGPGNEAGLPGRLSVRLSRGFGRVWEVALAAEDGAALDIRSLALRLLPLDRRP